MVTAALQQQVLACQTKGIAFPAGFSFQQRRTSSKTAASLVRTHTETRTVHGIRRAVGRGRRELADSSKSHDNQSEKFIPYTHLLRHLKEEESSRYHENVQSAETGKEGVELEETKTSSLSRQLIDAAVTGVLIGLLYTGHAPNAWADGMASMEPMSGGNDLGFTEWFGEMLYYIGQEANGLVKNQLASGITFGSAGVVFGAGLVTSFSPCTLSVLPLTIGYIGGFDQSKSRTSVAVDSLAFSLGLASTLAGLGVVASLAGSAYGQIGQGLPVVVSLVAILMGLNLLEVISLQLPSFFGNFNAKEAAAGFPSTVQAYLAGLTFALAASPCSTPVLATLLSYVASTQDPVRGGGLLLAYTTGYVSPLLLAASFTGALKQLLSLRQYSKWINPTSGSLLLGGGVYSLLTRVFPESSMMMMDMAM